MNLSHRLFYLSVLCTASTLCCMATVQAPVTPAILPIRQSKDSIPPQQRKCVVMDASNKVPLPRVDVALADGQLMKTDAHGCIVLHDTIRSVIFAKDGYIRQHIEGTLLKDTIYLEPAARMLPELSVVAQNKPKNINDAFRLSQSEIDLLAAQSQMPTGGFGIPVLYIAYKIVELAVKKWGKKKRELTKQILDNY